MAMKEMNAQAFEQEVLKAEGPVVLEFSAPWCGYCRRLAPAMERLEQELDGKVAVYQVNIDEEPELARTYEIDTIPSLVLFQGGKDTPPLVNPPSQAAVGEWLKENGAL